MQANAGSQGDKTLKIVSGAFPDSDENALAAIAKEMLAEHGPKAIRFDEPESSKYEAKSIIYTARHELIVEALNDPGRFALHHYDRAIPGTKFFLTSDTDEYAKRRRMIWEAFGERRHAGTLEDFGVDEAADQVTSMIVNDLNRRRGKTSEFDIIRAFNVLITYYVSRRVFGLAGTRNPPLLIHLVQILKWVQTRRKLALTPASQEAHAMYTAAQLVIGQLFVNFENRSRLLKFLGDGASSYLRKRFDHAIEKEKASPSGSILTELLQLKGTDALKDLSEADFNRNMYGIILEFVGTMVVLLSNGFNKMLLHMHETGLSFAEMGAHMHDPFHASAFLNECMRVRCPTGRLKRISAQDTELCGVPVRKGDYLCLMVPEGCHDQRVFPDPETRNLSRDPRSYIHFGPHEGPHSCLGPYWTREVLRQMFLKLATLDDLKFKTGNGSGLKSALKSEDSWPVTFSPRGAT